MGFQAPSKHDLAFKAHHASHAKSAERLCCGLCAKAGRSSNAENLRQMFPNNAKTTTIAGYFSANVSEALQFCSAEVASEALHHCFAGADSC